MQLIHSFCKPNFCGEYTHFFEMINYLIVCESLEPNMGAFEGKFQVEARREIARILNPPSIFKCFFDALIPIWNDKDLCFGWKSVFLEPLSNTWNETVRLQFRFFILLHRWKTPSLGTFTLITISRITSTWKPFTFQPKSRGKRCRSFFRSSLNSWNPTLISWSQGRLSI